MLETLVENKNRTVRGNRILIALRLLLATLALAILLLQQSIGERNRAGRTRMTSPSGEVNALLFSHDGKALFSGGSDATVRIWDVETGNESAPALEGHGDIVRQLALTPDGVRLASASDDGTVRIVDLKTGKWHKTLDLEPKSPVSVVNFSPDGKRVLVGGGKHRLQIWDAETAERLLVGPEDSQGAQFAAFLPDGLRIVSAGSAGEEGGAGKVFLWKADSLELEKEIDAHLQPIRAAALSPDGKVLVTGNTILKLWDMETSAAIRVSEGHPADLITDMSFDNNGDLFLTAGRDKRMILWSLDQAAPKLDFGENEHADWVLAAALSPDGTRAASGTGDKIIRVFDTQNGEVTKTLAGHRATLRLGPSPDEMLRIQEAPDKGGESLLLQPVYLILIIVLLLTILYTVALKREELAGKLAPLQIAVDIFLISALVYHTGSVDSPFVTLYLVSVVAAAFVMSWRGAILMAALAATLFSLTTLAYSTGFIPETLAYKNEALVRKFRDLGMLDHVRLLLLPICAFFLISALAGYLSRSLAVARLLHHEVLEGIGEGILVLDGQRNVLYHNQEIPRLLGVEKGLVGRSLAELINESVHENAGRVLAEGSSRRMEINFRRTDGTILPFEIRLRPVREDVQGPTTGVIAVIDDITAEKKMEEFFKHKERIETMGQISATIAHEIRNPLASIRGAVQEIARSVEIPESKKILIEIVLSESDRLDQIITDFLKYARMRMPKLRDVDITQLLSDLRLMLVSRAEAKDMDIRLESDEDIEPFLADSEQLRQVFLNLGVNAMQALGEQEEKRIVFKVTSKSLKDVQGLVGADVNEKLDRPGVLVEVIDNGPGMPDDVSDEIFEPFFTTKANGTGLGLAIVARIVQGHSGAVQVRSSKEKGTAFEIWLPTDLKAVEQQTKTNMQGVQPGIA